jgi:hypothetical protein
MMDIRIANTNTMYFSKMAGTSGLAGWLAVEPPTSTQFVTFLMQTRRRNYDQVHDIS